MKKNVTVRVLCLIVAAVVLCSAVTVAAFMGSPYEILKKAALDAVTDHNATVQGQVTMTVDGTVLGESKLHYIQGDNGYMAYTYDEHSDIAGYNYSANGLNINSMSGFMTEDGTKWYCADVLHQNAPKMRFGGISMISVDDRNSPRMRFMELFVDAMVGDLKNNITMSSEDGIRLISGTLTESQVPELVKAGIDMIAEQSGAYHFEDREISFDGKEHVYEDIRFERNKKTVTTWKQSVRSLTSEEEEWLADGTFHDKVYEKDRDNFYGFSFIDGLTYVNEGTRIFVNEYTAPVTRDDFKDSDLLSIPMKNLAINYVHGEAKVDADGNLLSVDINGAVTFTNIFGDTSEVEIKGALTISDIGTSNPLCPIPGAQQLLTPEYMKDHFGYEYVGVYFTLNEDGSINEDSITTTHPGEIYRQTEIMVEKGILSPRIEIRLENGLTTTTTTYAEEVVMPQDTLTEEEEQSIDPFEVEFKIDED
ncbi:MAG: hypothetical protein FWF85_04870 [Clostridiales bacterium]|jgi:hypothetical protein|nr:hypothetical protein [Clostridiales bacterium]MDR2713907.1 hypothetical protein [Clostridiales bacterium]